MTHITGLTWRRRIAVVAFLALFSALTFSASGAFADAGNPVLNTIQASSVDNGDTVTITVKGEWNWLSHSSDCNYDRAATGAGIIWNDLNGPGTTRGNAEVQRVTIVGGPTGGTFKLKFNGQTTGTIPWNATAAQVDTALEALSTVGANNVNVTGGPGPGTPFDVAFTGALAPKDVPQMTLANKSFTGGSGTNVLITTTTPGANPVYNGWLVANGPISAYVGTQFATTGAAVNPKDREVHPVDIGHKAQVPNLPGAPGQQIFDSGPNPTTGLGDYLTWKGGCGRQPVFTQALGLASATTTGTVVTLTLAAPYTNSGMVVGDTITVAGVTPTGYNGNFTITALVGTNQLKYNKTATLAAGTGGTVKDTAVAYGTDPSRAPAYGCGQYCGDPWGSWGYQTVTGYPQAYSHTYLKTLPDGSSGLPDQICVNFYDVHGGGATAPDFQLVQRASEIQVDGNGDNSIDTNMFNVLDGANCIKLDTSSITTEATSAKVGDPAGIHDTAHLNVPGTPGGTITFKVYGRNTATPDTATCDPSDLEQTFVVPVTGSGDYESGDYFPTKAGKYDWTADYSGAGPVTAVSSPCGAPNETSTVGTRSPALTTDAGPTQTLDGANGVNLFDRATLGSPAQPGFNATGTITFHLYRGAGCTPANEVAGSPVQIAAGDHQVHGDGTYDSASINVTQTGTYHWVAHYSGDENNDPASNPCVDAAETVIVTAASIAVTKVADAASVDAGTGIGFTITVTNNGDGAAQGVTATDTLPTDAGLSWSIESQTGSACSISLGVLTCNIGTLGAGGSYTVHITSPTTAATAADSPVDNHVHVSTTNDGTDDDDASVEVLGTAIAVTKTADNTSVSAGDTIGFTIVVTNPGPGKATGVTATDTLPTDAGLSWTIQSQDGTACSIALGVLTCAIGTMNANSTYNVHIVSPTTSATPATSPVDNTVHVSTTNDGDDEDDASVEVLGTAISISKTADNASVSAGETIGFTIVVTNPGPGKATGVVATDTLPTDAGLSWAIASQDGTACSIALGMLTCNIGTMDALASYTVHITSPTTSATPATSPVDNTVHVTTTNDGTDDDDASVEVLGTAISVTKTADNPSVSAGSAIGFTIKVTNPGPGKATGVTVTDTLPTDAGLNWSISTQDGTSCWITSGVLTCDLGTMNALGTYTVHITSPTTQATAATSPVDNHVDVTTTNDGTDDDDASVEVLGAAIAVSKTADNPSVSAGTAIGFTITVTNPGPGEATGVTVTDTLPADAGLVWSIESQDGTACTIVLGALTCDIGTMAANTSYTVHITSPTTSATAADSPVDNHVHVSTTNDGTDDDDASVEVLGTAIAVTKTADNTSVSAGDAIGFTIKVTNPGPGNATGVTVTDTLPTDAGLVWSIESQDGTACAIALGVLTCDIGTMAANTTYTVHITSPTSSATVASSPVDNTAHVSTTNDGTDDDAASVEVLGTAIAVTKTADNTSVSAGDAIGFTIKVTNPGPGKAYGVTVTDTLPTDAGTSWSISTQDGTACEIDSGVLTCDIGTMDANTSYSVHITSPTTSATPANSPVDNHVHVSTDNDGTDDDDASIEVLGTAIAINKTADDSPVSAGDAIGFTIKVTNPGPGMAAGVFVTDTLPTDAGLVWSIESQDGTACTILLGVLTCTLGTMNANTSYTVHITSPTTGATPADSPVDNTAHVTTTNAGSDDDDASVEVLGTTIAVTKTADNLSVSAGDTIGFTIKVTNPGPGKAYGVTVTDTLPTDAGTSWSISTQDGTACAIASGVLTCNIGTMAANTSYNVHVTSPTTGATVANSPVDNHVHVSTDNDGTDDDDASVEVLGTEIAVSKVADNSTVSAGDAIGFTIKVTNPGPGKAYGVTITDTLPTDAGLSWSIESQDGTACAIALGVLTCNIGTMDANATYTVHITSPTTGATPADSPVDNTAHVSTDNDGTDDDDASVEVLGTEIAIDKVADNPTVSAGDAIGFTIKVTNPGPGKAYGVTVTDTLPTDAGTSWSISTQDGTACAIASGVLTCNIGTMNANTTYTVHITSPTSGATVADSPVDNHVDVTTTNDGTDSDDASVEVLGTEIAVSKVADNPSVSAGDAVGFTIKVTNPGPGKAYGVTVTDTLPTDAGLSWSIESQDGTACAIALGVLTCNIGTMDANTTYTVHITSPTTAATPADSPVDNTAHVSTDNDGTDDDDESIEVLGPNVAISKVADAPFVSPGDPIGFTVSVTNSGAGTAHGVTVNDPLPAGSGTGVVWSIDTQSNPVPALCSISGAPGAQTLACGGLTTDVAPAGGFSVHITATTSTAECSTYDNTATVTTSNGGGDTDTASISCLATQMSVRDLLIGLPATANGTVSYTAYHSLTACNTATGGVSTGGGTVTNGSVPYSDPVLVGPGPSFGDTVWFTATYDPAGGGSSFTTDCTEMATTNP